MKIFINTCRKYFIPYNSVSNFIVYHINSVIGFDKMN